MSLTGFKPMAMDVGKYLRACADCGKKMYEVEELFKGINSVESLGMGETLRLADFIGVSRAQFLDMYVYE